MGAGETNAFPKSFPQNNEMAFEADHFVAIFPGVTDVVAGVDNPIARARASPLNTGVRDASSLFSSSGIVAPGASVNTNERPPDISLTVKGKPDNSRFWIWVAAGILAVILIMR